MKHQCHIVFTSILQLQSIRIEDKTDDIIVLLLEKDEIIVRKNVDISKSSCVIKEMVMDAAIVSLVFISKDDRFSKDTLIKSIIKIISKPKICPLVLLVPYLSPPMKNRYDGMVQSFIVSPALFFEFNCCLDIFSDIAYQLTYRYLESESSKNIEIIQVGKPYEHKIDGVKGQLNDSSILIPHKGSLKLLNRCLSHLEQAEDLPANVDICFDDGSWKKFNMDVFPNLKKITRLYKNNPPGVGPFVPRHFLIDQSKYNFIFHLDSDDISVGSRFELQMAELKRRKVDMLGSHELRIDEIVKKILIIRFPLDVSEALSNNVFHPLLHSTSVVTKSAYLKTGGYSTAGKFGYDSQFLLRSHFFLKIGNIDEFLYIRYKRPNSLTTNKNTMIGSDRRSFMAWRWKVDFRLISLGKLKLEDSSLKATAHGYKYTMEELA